MAYLIKDNITGEIVGYKALSKVEASRIQTEGDYTPVPFYDIATCKKVISYLERGKK